METLFQDLRYSLRRLLKSPGLSAVVVLSLALGIGVNVAIFSLVNALLLRPLPGVANQSSLVWVMSAREDGPPAISGSYPDYIDIRDRNDVFSGVLAFDNTQFSLSTGDQPQVVFGQLASANYFNVLGVKPTLGRVFTDADGGPSPQAVVVLGYGYWQRQFGGDPGAVGRIVSLNDIPFTVIGVTPREFGGTEAGMTPDLWVPAPMLTLLTPPIRPEDDSLNRRDFRRFQLWGRLKPGVSADQAQAAVEALASNLASENPATNEKMTLLLTPVIGGINPTDQGDMIPVAGLMMTVVGLVLLIACANVANLLLMRASLRQKEIAIRLSIGATRLRLVRQLLTESLVLFLIGGLVGLAAAQTAANLLIGLAPTDRPLHVDSILDGRVLVFALIVSIVSGLVFGLAPALRASKQDLVSSLKNEGFAPSASASMPRLRSIFVVGQITLSLVLVICAGLFVRTLLSAQTVDPGFQARSGLIVPVNLGLLRYDETASRDFVRRFSERVEAIPSVESVSVARTAPLGSSSGETEFGIDGRDVDNEDFAPYAGINVVGTKYFQTMGIALSRGRDFTPADGPDTPKVAIVNETMARRFWPAGDPLGARLLLGGKDGDRVEVVGIARDSKYGSLGETPKPYVYVALTQNFTPEMNFVVRTGGNPAAIADLVRSNVREMDAKLPPPEIRTLGQQVSLSLAPVRAATALVGGFGALALTLAAVGLFGVLAYSVTQRTREIGIRMAIGARRTDILILILREGTILVAAGSLLGLIIAFVATRFLSSFVYGVSLTDPVTFIGGAAVLAAVALIASIVPALRAMRVDPYVALRSQ